MRFRLLYIGKSKSTALQSEMSTLVKRIGRFATIGEELVPDIKKATSYPPEVLKIKEGESFLSRIDTAEHVVLLDEGGKAYDSRGMAAMIDKHFMDVRRPMTFVIGGAFGFSEAMYARADDKLSLSKMTFSHQLIRLIFLEQLYRSLTIIKGHPYHND